MELNSSNGSLKDFPSAVKRSPEEGGTQNFLIQLRFAYNINKCIVRAGPTYDLPIFMVTMLQTIACSADVEHLAGFEFNVRIRYEGTTTG